MGVTELADHSDSVRNVNTMIMSVFNENEQRSLQTTIPKKYMGNKKYQKGVPLQWKKDIVQYATSVADYGLPIASYGWKNEECLVCFYRHMFFYFSSFLRHMLPPSKPKTIQLDFDAISVYQNFII